MWRKCPPSIKPAHVKHFTVWWYILHPSQLRFPTRECSQGKFLEIVHMLFNAIDFFPLRLYLADTMHYNENAQRKQYHDKKRRKEVFCPISKVHNCFLCASSEVLEEKNQYIEAKLLEQLFIVVGVQSVCFTWVCVHLCVCRTLCVYSCVCAVCVCKNKHACV